jgi:hypothetical protein
MPAHGVGGGAAIAIGQSRVPGTNHEWRGANRHQRRRARGRRHPIGRRGAAEWIVGHCGGHGTSAPTNILVCMHAWGRRNRGRLGWGHACLCLAPASSCQHVPSHMRPLVVAAPTIGSHLHVTRRPSPARRSGPDSDAVTAMAGACHVCSCSLYRICAQRSLGVRSAAWSRNIWEPQPSGNKLMRLCLLSIHPSDLEISSHAGESDEDLARRLQVCGWLVMRWRGIKCDSSRTCYAHN